MAAYVISEVEAILDQAAMERYRALAARSIAAFDGRYLVRGGEAATIEGTPKAGMIIVVEFPSMARAREWYASTEYAEALKLRQTALERRLIFVEGVPQVAATA
jgi:uncharacterized protein (DUF1330 family)